jgi:dienelactone hydrolase
VGYKVEHVYDHSRTFRSGYDYEGNRVQEEIARPIQITIWYPAVPENKGKRMSYGEYFMDEATEIDFTQNMVEARERSLKKAKDFALGTDAKPESVDAVYAERTYAYRDAHPFQGKFPLILYAPSYSDSSSENVIVCEYLASHGFVIASCPGVGISTRIIKEAVPEVEAQTRDLEFVLAHMRDFPSVDFDKIGAFGFSWGSIYTTWLAMRNSKIGAVVSLEGSTGYGRRLEFIYGLPGFNPKEMRASYMYLSSFPPEGIEDPHDHRFYNECIYSDAFLIQFPEVHHAYFCSYYLKTYDIMSDEWKKGEDPERIFKGYETACRYLKHFFNASLNSDEDSKGFLHKNPEENGIPEGLIFVKKRPGLKPPPTQSQFFEIIDKMGEEEAMRIYKEARDRDPSVMIFYESDMDSLGHRLLKDGNTQKAISVFNLNAEAYPESARVYSSLGDAHLKIGETNVAVEYFQKALKIDPNNHSIKEKLKKLGIKN